MTDIRSRLRHRLFHTYFLFRRPMTLGARGVVIDEATQSVFLIRHTYVPGWQFPGGGVESGHTVEQTLAKELMEEGNIELTGRPQLFAIYHNAHASKRDHVALYVCRSFRQTAPFLSNREIAEAGFFKLDALPEGTTPSTRRRLAEIMDGAEVPLAW
ncbi:NUDIX domain-containing protein [Phyllobacterium zundukense]|uniref:DNA mismatch repair protein MutT n=1 Tax=Phyllobacterium zundukense TaxID=1867719 RepID=A0A2N9VZG1_9HYPH|nr:NUDIX domain-containing protein [Phyllobacterium zundukense]ATU90868.1 DNA mismatch repair protein MutT [Phyllobacterium zundukense]PIO44879.1 DNA mismatch repair protein MutT [Phyllobacterium zundukense]